MRKAAATSRNIVDVAAFVRPELRHVIKMAETDTFC